MRQRARGRAGHPGRPGLSSGRCPDRPAAGCRRVLPLGIALWLIALPGLPACAQEKRMHAVIEMATGGEIRIELFPADAPKTVESFVTLSRKGFYNGLTFHRVVPGFVVQGGDPKGDGTGGPGYTLKAEFNQRKHVRGTVAMARSQHPDSAGSQFYICFAPAPHLDGSYTVFGQVVAGMELVDRIKVGDRMKAVRIDEAAKP